MTITSEKEKAEILKYCENITNIAPENSVEYKIAKLALIQLNDEHHEIISLCNSIKENAPADSAQNKVAQLVLNQFDEITKSTLLNIPQGWKLVPEEPTSKMFMFIPAMTAMTINQDQYDVSRHNERNATWIYKQMLKLAPSTK